MGSPDNPARESAESSGRKDLAKPSDTFSYELKTYRETVLKVSQSKLADTLECDHSYVSRLEGKGRNPSREFMQKIIDVTRPTEYWEARLCAAAGFLPLTPGVNPIADPYSIRLIKHAMLDEALPEDTRLAIRQLVDSLADVVKVLIAPR